MGYIRTESKINADLIILNTCCVRENAELKVYGHLGALKKMKRENPNLIIALCGCMMQQKHMAENIIKKFPFVDIIFGTHNAYKFPQYLNTVRQENSSVVEIQDRETGIVEDIPIDRESTVKAFVTIMYGCNNFCSYCIVPYTRGRERSRQPEAIIKELEEIAALGYREVTLLGQNVNSYGHGLEKEIDFADLLEMASAVEGINRIRFTTSHPKDMSDKLIGAVAILPKVCEHIHVPLQAGSNEVLRRMNRHYTREHYLELTHKIRQRIPGVAITSDLIVGFPGESEEDFLDTLDMVKKVRFEAAFTFMYSPRSGTRAASWEEQLDLEEKKERLQRLNQVQYQIATEINQSMQGSIKEVMVEGPSKTNPEKLTSRTRTNHIVIFSGPKDLIGQLINVRIIEARTFSLFGEVVN